MPSFKEYVSEKRVLDLLISERVKVALKGRMKGVSPGYRDRKANNISEEISLLMPQRDLWRRPQRRERKNYSNNDTGKTRKQVLRRSLSITIRKHRKSYADYPYLERLDKFIRDIQDAVSNGSPLSFESIRITGKVKKKTPDRIILRPICVFTSLREKILIALANKYLAEAFDPLLHEEILSYRPLRQYHNSEEPVITNRDNAVENILAYRQKNKGRPIYVTECDIQKYFDTINHDVIIKYFDKLAAAVKEKNPCFDYDNPKRILMAYLNSYSFYRNVLSRNENMANCNTPRMFEGPEDACFTESGCYTADELNESRDKIGIPQGGALSGLISNVILNCIDRESVLKDADENRFFCRYGDDIILMHTDRDKCTELIDAYCSKLTENKLLYHKFTSVDSEDLRRSNGTINSGYWNQKSRNPYLWGRNADNKNCVDWIGFLGYEIRYTGEVRLRRSSLDEKFRGIKKKYHNGCKAKITTGELKNKSPEAVNAAIQRRIDSFAGDGLSTARSLTRNRYCVTQALKLNRYNSFLLYKLLYKIAKNNNLQPDELQQWWQKAKDSGCFNYLKTVNNPKRV